MSKRIISDGIVALGVGSGNERTLAASDSFGPAVVIPGYINSDGNFVGFKDDSETELSFTSSFQVVQSGGIDMKYAVSVSSSDATTNILIEEFPHGR